MIMLGEVPHYWYHSFTGLFFKTGKISAQLTHDVRRVMCNLRKFGLSLTHLVIITLLLVGCTGGHENNPIAPSNADDIQIQDAPPPNTSDTLIGQWEFGPEECEIDLDWFMLEFPEMADSDPLTVILYETSLQDPAEGVTVGRISLPDRSAPEATTAGRAGLWLGRRPAFGARRAGRSRDRQRHG